MPAEPLDDDYRSMLPIPYEDTLCPLCAAELEGLRCIDCELRHEAEREALTQAAIPNKDHG